LLFLSHQLLAPVAGKKNKLISFRERSLDNHTQFQTKIVQNLYPFSDQNGSKTILFGAVHTYIPHIGEYSPVFRGHFLNEEIKVLYFVDEFGPFLVDLEKWPPRNEVALGLDSPG